MIFKYKDKNGREIKTGDVLQSKDYGTMKVIEYENSYGRTQLGVNAQNKKCEFSIPCCYLLSAFDMNDWEVKDDSMDN